MSVSQAEAIATRNALGYFLTQKVCIKDGNAHQLINRLIMGLNRGNPPLHEADRCFVDWVVLNLSSTKAAHSAAFMTALKIGHIEAIKALIMHGEIAPYECFNQFILANQNNNMPIVRAFLETGKMALGFCDQVFRECCERRDFETLKALSVNRISAPLFAANYSFFQVRGDLEMVAALNSFEQAAPYRNPSPATTDSFRTASASPPAEPIPSPAPLIGRMECEGTYGDSPEDLLEQMLLFPKYH